MLSKLKKIVNKKNSKTVDPNSENKKEILKFMKLAMNTEKKGIKFYKEAKRRVKDYNMNKLMDVLIEQERTHLEFFNKLYKAQKKKNGNPSAVAAKYKKQSKIKNPLFRKKQLDEVANKKSIYHIFNQALRFEQDGHDMYVDMAKKVKDKKIKQFLRMVAQEELKHKDFIRMHQEAIYNTGYWHGIGHVRLQT